MYTPIWARPGHDTSTLSQKDLLAYWKARSLRDDCEFYLSVSALTPEEHAQLSALWFSLQTRKAKPADRVLVAGIREAVQMRAYQADKARQIAQTAQDIDDAAAEAVWQLHCALYIGQATDVPDVDWGTLDCHYTRGVAVY